MKNYKIGDIFKKKDGDYSELFEIRDIIPANEHSAEKYAIHSNKDEAIFPEIFGTKTEINNLFIKIGEKN